MRKFFFVCFILLLCIVSVLGIKLYIDKKVEVVSKELKNEISLLSKEKDGKILEMKNTIDNLKKEFNSLQDVKKWNITTIGTDIKTIDSKNPLVWIELNPKTYTITRPDGLDSYNNLTWVVKDEEDISLLERNALWELTFRYFRNDPGSTYTVYLNAWVSDRYVPISNKITYTVQ